MKSVFGVTGTIGLTIVGTHLNLNIANDDNTSNVYLTADQCQELATRLQQLADKIDREHHD